MTAPRTPDTTTLADRLAGCVASFASAVKNLTVYPKDHPRVVARADEFAQQFGACVADSQEITVVADGLRLAENEVAPDNLAVQWLAQRCREAGVRAIAIDPGCIPEDVIRFAEALVACRPGSGQSLPQTWHDESARVRPIELVVGDHHSAHGGNGNGNGSPPPEGELAVQGLRSGLGQQLREIAERPSVRNLIEAIESAGGEEYASDEPGKQVDLVGAIGELIPADGPADVDALASTVEDILSRTLGEAMELVRSDRRVRGADVMRSAVQMARAFFARPETDAVAPQALPEGRPEDEHIQADLPALLAELNELPPAHDLRLPAAQELELGAPTTSRELLGICLHGLSETTDKDQRQIRVRWITALCARQPDAGLDVLDAYLGATSPIPQHARMDMLQDLVGAGLHETIRNGGYVDNELLRSGFPEVLALAARALRSPDERHRLRTALDDIAPLLDNGGAQAAADGGHLDATETISLLASTGGRTALQLLAHSRNESGLREVLLERSRELGLPNTERVALKLHAADQLPRGYLQRLLRACARQDFIGSTRTATAEILCNFLEQNLRELPAVKLSVAIDALEEAPCPQARQCLKSVMRAGRFSLSSELRALRQQAREVLERMDAPRRT